MFSFVKLFKLYCCCSCCCRHRTPAAAEPVAAVAVMSKRMPRRRRVAATVEVVEISDTDDIDELYAAHGIVVPIEVIYGGAERVAGYIKEEQKKQNREWRFFEG